MILQLVKGDITAIEVDAMVNAANSQLAGGGGVDGAIHFAGGPDIMRECDEIREKEGGCPVGKAVLTGAGNLPAKKVIHAVGPIFEGGKKNESELLRNAYATCLRLAHENLLKVISFPNISTGVYGYPKKEAAKIAMDTVRSFHNKNNVIERIVFVCFDYESFEIYRTLLKDDLTEGYV